MEKNIMRRVYYAFVLRQATSPVALHGVALLGLFFALTYFVSIPNVIQNISHVEVGSVGRYMLTALMTTEIWTLLILGGIIMAAFSLRFRLRSPHKSHLQTI